MGEYSEIQSLAAAVKEQLEQTPTALIAIEGHSTSGKTYLSNDLATRVGAVAIETDSFAREDLSAPTYVERIDTDRLGRKLTELKASGSPVVVEGICLRDTLDAAGVAPNLFIYVKRITAAELWADDPENELEGNWTDMQSIDYHARESPLERADLVYLRREE